MNLSSAALALLFSAALLAPAQARTDLTVPPTVAVDGLSQAEWSRSWWQWAASFERSESPVADQTGALCASGQSGKVWFLAGTYGTHRTVRTCKVPRDKYLFFPLINYATFPNGRTRTDCASVTETAARMTNNAAGLVLEIDGARVPDLPSYRQATRECFDLGVRGTPRTRVYPAAANGYYVMLPPLSPGKHTLNFGGALSSMLQAVTYTLVVE